MSTPPEPRDAVSPTPSPGSGELVQVDASTFARLLADPDFRRDALPTANGLGGTGQIIRNQLVRAAMGKPSGPFIEPYMREWMLELIRPLRQNWVGACDRLYGWLTRDSGYQRPTVLVYYTDKRGRPRTGALGPGPEGSITWRDASR